MVFELTNFSCNHFCWHGSRLREALLNRVLGDLLEDLSEPLHTTMNWNVNGLLDELRHDVRHFTSSCPICGTVTLSAQSGGSSTNSGCLGRRLRGASCAASAPVLSVFSARRPEYFASAATLSKLWWTAADRAIATLSCSCRHHERWRRCLRRHVAR